MSIVHKHLATVNEHMAVQTKLAAKYQQQQWRRQLHLESYEKFKAMAADLAEADRMLDEYAAAPPRPEIKANRLTLRPEEIKDLPAELVAELSNAGYDKVEESIVEAIKTNGGIASMDQLLVAVYRKTGEVYKRNTLTSRLYRMAQKGYVYTVPGKKGVRKGVYTLTQLTEEEAAKLLLVDGESEPEEEASEKPPNRKRA